MTKSEKLYSKSPTIKRGESGKVSVEKPTPAAATDMGLEGNPLPGDDGEMPIQVKQTTDMHERHIQEMKDMHKRHQKEHEKLASDHSGLSDTLTEKVEE